MSADKTKWVRLGDYIEKSDEINSERRFGIEAISSESIIATIGISFGSTHTIFISASSSVIT